MEFLNGGLQIGENFMKIYGIILYKTPLSNSYENVFDTDEVIRSQHTYSLIYKRFLENYEHMELVVDLKSINRFNDGIVITLPYDYDTLHDYNYCCLWYWNIFICRCNCCYNS